MPQWACLLYTSLFNLRVNIRFGCVILRYYLDMEQGSLYRALGRDVYKRQGRKWQQDRLTLLLNRCII